MSIELKRKEVELMRIQAARAELELKVLDLQGEIAKVEAAMASQLAREAELKAQIEKMKQ